ncbi:exocyst complex component EXO70B1 [Lycium ferocissimum]|uniref:exocyst complex component EXO70B1 n=1 Tax=Lycium ferocissimum TaxID=112874 RepID=UPI0028149A9F|nr:exocyst complex component EXO70B1 [Lycium ferocissimum]
MAENGEEKLIAVARHIAKTLGHTDTMTDDILQIFSNFDNRLREKLTDDQDQLPNANSLERTLKSLHRQISRYVSTEHPIWSDSADSATSFLHSIDELISTIREWNNDKSVSVSTFLDKAEDLLQQAMFRLEDEFATLMMQQRASEPVDLTRDETYDSDSDDFSTDEIPTALPVTDYDILIEALPAGIISDLHEIAKRMVVAGYGKECSRAYSACRREFLEESLSRLGLQKKLSIDEVQKMQWNDLEDEIEKWVKAVNVSLRILLPSERRLCDRVFFGLTSVCDLSFMEVSRSCTVQLLNFADAIAISSRAPERLFKVLDVYEALRDLMPEFELLFSDSQYCVLLRNEALAIWRRLGEAIRGIFMELENLIRRDPAKAPVPGGGLHPITRYVMNYLRAACRSRITLQQVFEEMDDDRALSSSSSMAVQMAWIMELLESNLEAKAKTYKDSALLAVFMMNNERYIVHKVKDSELGLLLGDDWIRKHAAKVKQYHVNYQRSSWSKVLGALKIDNNSNNNGMSPTRSLKEKLKLFNSYFEEVCKTQSTWIIFDEQLKEDIRNSVAGALSPAYRNFIARMHDTGRHTERHIKFSVEDLEARIADLFQGSSGRK